MEPFLDAGTTIEARTALSTRTTIDAKFKLGVTKMLWTSSPCSNIGYNHTHLYDLSVSATTIDVRIISLAGTIFDAGAIKSAIPCSNGHPSVPLGKVPPH